MPDYTPRQRRIIRNYYDNRLDLCVEIALGCWEGSASAI